MQRDKRSSSYKSKERLTFSCAGNPVTKRDSLSGFFIFPHPTGYPTGTGFKKGENKMKTEFDIGEWVEAKAIVYFDYDYPENRAKKPILKRKMFKQKITKKGIVSGMSYRNIGERKEPYWNEQAEFKTTKRILVYLIKEGMINKPFECLEKDLKKILPEKFPFCKRHKVIWTKEMRQEMSNYAKEFPRDKKGKFI